MLLNLVRNYTTIGAAPTAQPTDAPISITTAKYVYAYINLATGASIDQANREDMEKRELKNEVE